MASNEHQGMGDGPPPSTPDWLSLASGESVVFRAGPSKNLLLVGLAVGMLILVGVSVLVSAIGDIIAGRVISFAGLLVFGGILGGIYLLVHRWEYVVTSERVCVTRSIGDQTQDEVRLDDVGDISMDQSWWQQVVDVGDLHFAAGGQTLTFDSIEHPRVVYEEVLTLVE